MYGKNAHAQYQSVQVTTTDRGRLLLMMYEGAIKFLKQSKAGLEAKSQAHEASRPSGLRAMISGAARLDEWHGVAERLARTQARVERHLGLVARLAQPGVGHYEAASMRLARRNAAKVAPDLMREVQRVVSDRAARLVEQRCEQGAQLPTAGRALHR